MTMTIVRKCQMLRYQFSFIFRTYLTGLTMPLPNTIRTQTYKLTINNKYTNLHNIQLIQETQFNTTTHERMPTRSKKTCDNSVLCPRTRSGPWQLPPHTDSSYRPRSRHFVTMTRTDTSHKAACGYLPYRVLRRTIVDASSLQRRTSTLPKRARRNAYTMCSLPLTDVKCGPSIGLNSRATKARSVPSR